MNILLTGDMGFIGTNLKKKLNYYRGYDIKTGFDILDKSTLDVCMKGIDTVIHLAALINVEESKNQPDRYIQTNIQGTINIIESAIKNGVTKIVYASSAACYEPDSSTYAMTKYAAENLMGIYSKMINTVSLRFFNIYGLGQSSYSAVINAFIKGIEKGEVTIYGDGNQTRDFIAVEDVCDAIIKAAESDAESGSVMDIGTGEETTVNDLLAIMSKINRKQVKVEYGLKRSEVRHSKANVEIAKELIGFQSTIKLKDGLEAMMK